VTARQRCSRGKRDNLSAFHCIVIARSQWVRPEVAGPMTGSATKQSRNASAATELIRSARNDGVDFAI
jgi:hypothetical protein